MKPSETAPATIEALVLGDETDLPAVRAVARKAVPMLVTELESEHPNRDNSAAALGQFGPAAKDAVPALTKALDDQNICHEAAKALVRILPADEAVPLFVPRLQELNGSVHQAAAQALGLLGPNAKEATGALIQCLNRKRNECFACRALARIGTASDAVIPALIEALNSESDNVCHFSAEALGEIGPEAKSAVPVLIQVLNERISDYARLKAAEALGQIGPAANEAIPVLTKLANTEPRHGEARESEILRENAAKALRLIEPEDVPRD
jgi:HEAT repeat protein